MATQFRVVDLTASPETPLQGGGSVGSVDLEKLREQLSEIRDALTPVLEEQGSQRNFELESIELDLTVGLEGQVWFIAKGKGEASLKLTWSRGDAAA